MGYGGQKLLFKFLQLVKSQYGINPIIYAHQRFYNTYLRNRFPEYNIRIARQNGHQLEPKNNQMYKEPILFDGRSPLIWQYSGTGTINGINLGENFFKPALLEDVLDFEGFSTEKLQLRIEAL